MTIPWAHVVAAFIAASSPGSVIGILGAPGTGKTLTAQAVDQLGAFRRRAVFDAYAREDRLNWNAGHRERTPWAGRLVTVPDLRRSPELLDRDPLRLVATQDYLDESTIGEDFGLFASLLWTTGGIDLIGEEFGVYGRQAVELVNRVASGGAHARMRAVFICQSLGRVQKDARRCFNRLVVFAQAEDDDLKSLRSRCGAQFASRVQALVPGAPPLFWSLGDRTTEKA